jgi:hypothetical protein
MPLSWSIAGQIVRIHYRRKAKKGGESMEVKGRWVTMNGAKVFITDKGDVVMGLGKGDTKDTKKITKLDFIKQVKDNGHIPLDNDLYYVVAKISDDNFKDISPKFKEQLKDEGLYNKSYIGFISRSAKPPYTVRVLPIYGSSSKYETKWFTDSVEKAINRDLNDRNMKLLKRANG